MTKPEQDPAEMRRLNALSIAMQMGKADSIAELLKQAENIDSYLKGDPQVVTAPSTPLRSS